MENETKENVQGSSGLRFRHTFITPLLVCVIFVLLLITRTVDFSAVEGSATQAYLSLVAVQLFVFVLPCVFYIRYRSLDISRDIRLRLPSPDKIMFIALCSLILIFTSVLFFAAGGGKSSIYSSGSDFGSEAPLYYAVCFALVPAFCEELLFRGIVMSEYQHSSVFTAVMLSSLFFAMLHFDAAGLPFYFVSGLVLAMCAYAANSIIASFAVHLLYNLFALFGGDVVEYVLGSLGELGAVLTVLGALLLLCLALTFGECQRIYFSYAKKNRDSFYVVKYKKGTGGIRFFSALFSPASLVIAVMYITVILISK